MKSHIALLMAGILSVNQASAVESIDFHQNTMAGRALDAKQIEALEASLDEKPDDMSARAKILGYYFGREGRRGEGRDRRRKQILWVIQNHPDSELLALPYCHLDTVFDPEGYVEAKKLWVAQTEAHPKDAKVLAHAAAFFRLSDKDLAEGFLKRARTVEPSNPNWADELGRLYSLQDGKDAAAKALAEYESAQAADDEKMTQFYRLDQLAKAAIQADDLEKATRYAQAALDGAKTYPGDWNEGNAIHSGNSVLGLVALKQGNPKLAVEYLLKAGKTSGSPQLDSFGPNMRLAKALLEKGEKKPVLEYFELCRKFWKMGGDKLDRWTKDVDAGNDPDFGGNLMY